ncbi:YciI family protein [Streptomyces spiralis]|uniref:YciI family protein n=1 Tax=Streptomyces spiralis TaxID=66376 RepID=UPI00340AF9D6
MHLLRLQGDGAPTERARLKGRPEMKFLLLIYGNQEKWDSFPAESWPEAIAKQEAFNAKYRETGELLGSYGLVDAANARLVRRKDGAPAVTDGPYLETKEYMASFWLLDCESERRAHEIAADMPWADTAPTEVWPILHDSAADL